MGLVLPSFSEFFTLLVALLTAFVQLWPVIECSAFLSSSGPSELRRKIMCKVNPGCEDNYNCSTALSKAYFAVVHIQARGDDDVVHYLWSNYKYPSFFIARTTNSTILTIDWDTFFNEEHESGINFTEKPLYSFGIILSEIFEYNDVKDHGAYSTQQKRLIDVQNFVWSNVTELIDSHDYSCSVKFVTRNSKSLEHGQFQIQVLTYGRDITGPLLPHLLLTPESSQLTWSLQGFVGNFTKSRYALKFIVLSSIKPNRPEFKLAGHKTIDDEYSPGVFRTFTITTSESQNTSSGYLVWKPVSYTDADRLVAHSSDTTIKKLLPFNGTGLPNSVATKYFSRVPYSLTTFVASFGTSGDSFYTNTNYTEWTLAMGYGMIREESMSQLVILVIVIGLGLPVVIMISGGIYLGARKLCQQKDELLLDRDSSDQ